MNVAEGRAVSLSFRLETSTGELLDESKEGEPLTYIHGTEGILPAVANCLDGKAAGHQFELAINAAEAYGEYDPTAVKTVPRSAFPAAPALQLGMQVNDSNPDNPIPAVITGIDGDTVTLDMNHPLAGIDLLFSGCIEAVEESAP